MVGRNLKRFDVHPSGLWVEIPRKQTWKTQIHPKTMENKNPSKTNMTMENPPFEDVSPIKNGDFPASHVTFHGCIPEKTCSL